MMLIEQVLTQIKVEAFLQLPRPIHTLAEVRDKRKYCKFYQDHGHRTNEFRHLKDQVETLIRQ